MFPLTWSDSSIAQASSSQIICKTHLPMIKSDSKCYKLLSWQRAVHIVYHKTCVCGKKQKWSFAAGFSMTSLTISASVLPYFFISLNGSCASLPVVFLCIPFCCPYFTVALSDLSSFVTKCVTKFTNRFWWVCRTWLYFLAKA